MKILSVCFPFMVASPTCANLYLYSANKAVLEQFSAIFRAIKKHSVSLQNARVGSNLVRIIKEACRNLSHMIFLFYYQFFIILTPFGYKNTTVPQ
jgi:hypothetical protein